MVVKKAMLMARQLGIKTAEQTAAQMVYLKAGRSVVLKAAPMVVQMVERRAS